MKNERYLIKKLFKKFVNLCIFPVFSILGLTFTMGFYYEPNIYTKLDDITIELGDKLPEEVTHYTELIPNNKNLALETNVPLDKNGNTSKIGTYSYYLVYNNENYKFSQITNIKSKITVKDTIKPTIIILDSKEIEYGGQINIDDIVKCYDLSKCKVTLENKIDTKKSGTHEVFIEATDGAGNVSYESTTITVKEKPKPVVEQIVYNYNPYAGMAYQTMNDNNNAKNALLSEEEKDSLRIQIANFARQFIGNPYVYGGTSLTNGADCSGFTMSLYANYGYSLPRVAADQAYVGKAVSENELIPGDIIVYTYGHAGIYVGNGLMVHAATAASGITIQPMFDGYRVYRRIIF